MIGAQVKDVAQGGNGVVVVVVRVRCGAAPLGKDVVDAGNVLPIQCVVPLGGAAGCRAHRRITGGEAELRDALP